MMMTKKFVERRENPLIIKFVCGFSKHSIYVYTSISPFIKTHFVAISEPMVAFSGLRYESIFG
ncbi:CLUMA_CG004043, isoform A [Clunio marinus]|uniref:CLUMA_CG004043, isoform A n=1 Tax=Clunio marinus TaxID=568069 RepID=A0A1J1HW21_9DIPT|nr:CLUMA_CG004043, isoform A [Clunio marinus]